MDAPQPHDSLFRFAFGRPEHAAGVLAHALPAAIARCIDWSSLRVVPGSFVDDDLRQRHSDLLFEARTLEGGRVLVYLLFEHQSQADRWMPLRLLGYELRIWEQYRRDHPEADRVPWIVPVVLFHSNRPWRGPLELDALMAIEDDLRESVHSVLLRQRFVLLDLTVEDAASLRAIAATAFARVALFLMRYARSIQELSASLVSWAPLLREVSASPGREAVRALARYIESVNEDSEEERLAPLFEAAVDQVWGNEMATLEQRIRQAGVEQGRAQGRSEGREQGRSEGREQGREEGHEQGLVAGQRALLRTLIATRFGELSGGFEARLEQAMPAALESIARRLLTVDRVEDLFDEPIQGS